MDMTKEVAEKIIQSRTLINQPGYYEVQVTGVTPYQPEDGDMRLIVNLKAMTPYGVSEAKAALANDEFQEAVNTNLSTSVRTTDWCPAPREMVKAYVEYIETKDGDQALLVSSISEIKARRTSKVSLAEVEVPAEEFKGEE